MNRIHRCVLVLGVAYTLGAAASLFFPPAPGWASWAWLVTPLLAYVATVAIVRAIRRRRGLSRGRRRTPRPP